MKILFVADGRSPTAINWMRYFCEAGDEVVLVSTFACEPNLALQKKIVLPVAFSSVKKPTSSSKANFLFGASTLKIRTLIRQWLGPASISKAARVLRSIIQQEKPDLVHAMRIPFEGMVAADGYAGVPLVISVWGNDFTLHAESNKMMRHYTEWAMRVADGVQADCHRDIALARQYGLDAGKPTLVVPGSGGVRADIFYPAADESNLSLVVNPRGFRAYVRNDVFFKAIPLVLRDVPDARFVCPGMDAEPQVMEWVEQLGVGHAVDLLPPLSQPDLANLYRRSKVVVSPTIHDGTPNSLIEALACGCYPVAGDLESIREWIQDGVNGALVNPGSPESVARAIVRGLEDGELRARSREINLRLINERAEYRSGMEKVRQFYQRVMRSTT